MDLKQMMSSPLFNQAKQMYDACGKDPAQFEQVAKNICESRGIDYQQALASFQQMMTQNKDTIFANH